MFGHAIEPGIGETYISVGMNYLVRDIVDEQWNSFGFSINKSNHIANLENIYNDKKARWQAAAENSPTLYEYLRKNIFKEY